LRSYETAIIWSASIPEGDLETELNSVLDIISGADGTLAGTEKWGRRMLAYPISKQTEGIYHFIKWTGDPGIIPAINKYLRIREGCLRHLTLRSDGHPADASDLSGQPRSEEIAWTEDDDSDSNEGESEE